MARMEIKGIDDWMQKLSNYSDHIDEIAEKAVKAGANPVADEIRSSLASLPEDKFRYLRDGDFFSGVPSTQRKDLLEGFGITPVDVDHEGNTNVKIGFAGYGSHKTKKYPKGIPNALLARAIESGSSVRKKSPFVRKAVKRTKDKAISDMKKVIDEETKIYAL